MDEITWHDIYTARFGKVLTQQEIKTWDAEIEYQVKKCLSYEIVNAVRELAEQKRKGELKYSVNVNDVIRVIINIRFQEHQPFEAQVLTTKKEERMNELKYRIRNADTNAEKWDIICEPIRVPECAELERFAESLPGGFKRPEFPVVNTKNIGRG